MTRAILVNNKHNYIAYGHQYPTEDNFDTHPHAAVEVLIKAKWSEAVDATLYLWRYPCFECAKAIVYAGIGKIVYKYDNCGDPTHQEAQMFFEQSGIEVVKNENLDF